MKLSNLLNKPTSSVSELAKKYKVSPDSVEQQLAKGIKVEMEHTSLKSVAREIALDHLGEDLHYYEKLSKIEKIKVQEHQLVELFDLNKPPQGVQGPNLRFSQGRVAYYGFAVDDKKYFVEFHNFPEQDVEIVFGDEHGNVGLTHTGNATKVFWSVAQCLVDYLERHPSVQKIYFTSHSDEPSRLRLYHSLSNRLAQQLGWHASSKEGRKDVEYYVTKKPSRSLDENSLLVELFDLNKVPEGVRPPMWYSDDADSVTYVFSINKKTYECVFKNIGDQVYDLKFRDEKGLMTITGAGDSAKVFWAVAKAISKFVEEKTVKVLKFGANEPSRARLYSVLSQKMAQTLGWSREVIRYPGDPATYFRLYNPAYQKQPLEESRTTGVIVVDVQPAYAQGSSRGNQKLFERIIQFVNKQTGPVLMFVNAEQDMMTDDTVDDIKAYWEDVIRGEEWDPEDYDDTPIDWSRFQIKDKGFGFFRSFIDRGVSDKTIIRLIRLMYQNRVNDSRDLFGGEHSDDYAVNFEQFVGPEFKRWMLDDGFTVQWTSVAQLKRFSGSYIVGGGRNECLKEVELLMNAFNIKYKRIDSMVYG